MASNYFGIQVCPTRFWFTPSQHIGVQALGDGRSIMKRGRLPKDLSDPDPKLLLISEGFRMIVLANRGLI